MRFLLEKLTTKILKAIRAFKNEDAYIDLLQDDDIDLNKSNFKTISEDEFQHFVRSEGSPEKDKTLIMAFDDDRMFLFKTFIYNTFVPITKIDLDTVLYISFDPKDIMDGKQYYYDTLSFNDYEQMAKSDDLEYVKIMLAPQDEDKMKSRYKLKGYKTLTNKHDYKALKKSEYEDDLKNVNNVIENLEDLIKYQLNKYYQGTIDKETLSQYLSDYEQRIDAEKERLKTYYNYYRSKDSNRYKAIEDESKQKYRQYQTALIDIRYSKNRIKELEDEIAQYTKAIEDSKSSIQNIRNKKQ